MTAERKVICRYLLADGNRCTGEADDQGDAAWCDLAGSRLVAVC